jgi:hypothetical protein
VIGVNEHLSGTHMKFMFGGQMRDPSVNEALTGSARIS